MRHDAPAGAAAAQAGPLTLGLERSRHAELGLQWQANGRSLRAALWRRWRTAPLSFLLPPRDNR